MSEQTDVRGRVLTGTISWFKRHRTSVRWAFILRIFAMGAGALFSLVWTRLLLRAMGDALFGVFLSFQAVASLGGLGDLGMAGAVSIIANQMLGKGENEELKRLLASARTLFLGLAILLCVLFVALSPWLPEWLGFHEVAGGGSISLLFICGGLTVGGLVLAGYFAALNYAYGTVTWPIIPTVFINQILAQFVHWRLALLGTPLWVQSTTYVFTTVLGGAAAWLMLRWSHPWLGNLRPLGFDSGRWKMLWSTSGWVYLCSLGWVTYLTTDRLVINGWIGPEILPSYHANFKICALAASVIAVAGFVSFPKITQWLLSPEPSDRARARLEINRLSAFQTMLGCGVAMLYLAFNDLFVRVWLGAAYNGPLVWQAAFAASLVVTASGDVGIQVTSRCTDKGIRWAGLAWGGTGLLNLILAILSVRFGSVAGVAIATVIAQSLLSLGLNWRASRFLNLSPARWIMKTWALPMVTVLAASALKAWLPGQSLFHIGILLGSYALLFVAVSSLAGMKKEMFFAELAILRSALKAK